MPAELFRPWHRARRPPRAPDTVWQQMHADCRFRVITSKQNEELLGMPESEISVTLAGGLERGLLPPGDAIDGASLGVLAARFPMLPGSAFLHIRKIP